MKRFTAYSFLLLLAVLPSYGQTCQGWVYSARDSSALEGVEVYDHGSGTLSLSASSGRFTMELRGDSLREISVFKIGYHLVNGKMLWTTKDSLVIYLIPADNTLSEVSVSAKSSHKQRRYLRAVEGSQIYAAKKTEVVELDQLAIDKGSNNPRQIYAQLSGLNIYEGSGGGLQLNIGGRGLDPNRSSNFNVRQNGYDISADVLGYPESYYTPPAEAIREIQVVKGAASLQYGSQFGGLLQFQLLEAPEDTALAVGVRQSYGSFGRLSSFVSLGGSKGKWSYQSYFNYKQGEGWRPNSAYQSQNFFGNLGYRFNTRQSLNFEYSYFHYLAQQAGGLSDSQFEQAANFSNRSRNWFQVDWHLYALKHHWQLSAQDEWFTQLFALRAQRNAVGFRGLPQTFNQNPITSPDEKDPEGNFLYPRDLMRGSFQNWGLESKWIRRYQNSGHRRVFLLGLKYYQAKNRAQQGPGSLASDPDFSFYHQRFSDYPSQSNFTFPNRNLAFFGEHVWFIGERWSLTPGFRAEYIRTASEGSYLNLRYDNAGNLIFKERIRDDRLFERAFLLSGLGLSYRPSQELESYLNVSQNYRSVTFSDIRTVNPSFVIDPNIEDEQGFTADLGFRGRLGKFSVDHSLFTMLYDNRIGIILNNRAQRVRKNIGTALIYGWEAFSRYDTDFELFSKSFQLSVFVNLALTDSRYLRSEEANVPGNKVEFIPFVNLKNGLEISRGPWHLNLQMTSLSQQFTDVENSARPQAGDLREGIIGPIPAYSVWDLGLRYQNEKMELGFSLNNLGNQAYFTRRATGYPGPGIIPSDPLNWSIDLAYHF